MRAGLDVVVAGGEVTKLPWFRDELTRAMKSKIVDEYLWPRRMVIPTDVPGPEGVPLLSTAQLERLEYDDPLLRCAGGAGGWTEPQARPRGLARSRGGWCGPEGAGGGVRGGRLAAERSRR